MQSERPDRPRSFPHIGDSCTAAFLAALHVAAARECGAGRVRPPRSFEAETDLRAQIVDFGLGKLEDQSHVVSAVLVAIEVDLHLLGLQIQLRLFIDVLSHRVSWSRA